MKNLKTLLKDRLQGAKRIAVLGIGSDLRGDDAAGMLIAEHIEAYRKKLREARRIKVFFGSTAPESFTGVIKRFNPTHLLIIDAAEIKKNPGKVVLLDPQMIEGISFSTHSLPLKIMTDYLLTDIKECHITVIGIQPENLDFGSPLSVSVGKAVRDVAKMVEDSLRIS